MMKYIFSGLILISVFFGIINGKTSEVSSAAVSSCADAISLAITLGGVICLWSGIMNIASKSGAVSLIAKAVSPVLSKLFKGIDRDGEAMGYIVLNLVANALGLGNASTPFGISALKALSKEEKKGNTDGIATDNMILFIAMNTASLQIFPATAAALRLKYGSENAFGILPAVWFVSITALTVVIVSAKISAKIFKKREKAGNL